MVVVLLVVGCGRGGLERRKFFACLYTRLSIPPSKCRFSPQFSTLHYSSSSDLPVFCPAFNIHHHPWWLAGWLVAYFKNGHSAKRKERLRPDRSVVAANYQSKWEKAG